MVYWQQLRSYPTDNNEDHVLCSCQGGVTAVGGMRAVVYRQQRRPCPVSLLGKDGDGGILATIVRER